MRIFSYGLLCDPDFMESAYPGAGFVGPASLAGWQLQFRGVADVEPAPGRVVYGCVWDVAEADVPAMDHLESAYVRVPVEVRMLSGAGELVGAEVYSMPHPWPLSPPSSYYLESIERGYLTFLPTAARVVLWEAIGRAAA